MSESISKVIAVEEHFMSAGVNEQYNEIFSKASAQPAQRAKAQFISDFVAKGEITEVGARRLAYMDEAGIDVQILSYGNNSPMYLDAEYAVPLCRQANDELAGFCAAAPGRFYGFATLPVADVRASAEELERCVRTLGFKGVIFNGACHGHFFDEDVFFLLFQKAAELHIPVMFHPGEVDPRVSDYYYRGSWPLSVTNVFAGHGIGWHYDSGMQYLRMILSGVFDKLPDLTLICGHWGETLPYYFNRLDHTLTPELTGLKHRISEYFRSNMYLTPSGMFYDDQFRFCLEKVGPDRILWATDYPYCKPGNCKQYLSRMPIPRPDQEKIAHENAEKLFGI